MRMRLVLFLLMLAQMGCQHNIHVDPLPAQPSGITIPRAVQLLTGPLLIEGADHMPGITLLEWPHRDLSQALIQYVRRRETFASVSATPADLTLAIATKLSMRSRDRYWYTIQLKAEMKETTRTIKTYVVEQQAEGSAVRWVTASDRDPIERALQLALDDLLTKIEADRSLYAAPAGRATR